MLKLVWRGLGLGIAVLALSACAVEASDSGYIEPPSSNLDDSNPMDFVNQVPGPDLDGDWRSSCVLDNVDPRYWDILTMHVYGQAITRETTRYYDPGCAELAESRMEQGQFRYLAETSYDVFALEYRFKADDGGIDTVFENLRDNGFQIWLSGEQGGGAPPTIPLLRN